MIIMLLHACLMHFSFDAWWGVVVVVVLLVVVVV